MDEEELKNRMLEEREIAFQNAQALERARFIEEERLRRAQNEQDVKIMQAEIIAQEKKETKKGVGKVTFVMMMTLAITCDIILALIASFIPFVGWVINAFLTIIIFLTFFMWFKMKGIKFNSPRKLATLPIGLIIELIPYINILPGWTVSVIINTQAGNLTSKIGLK